MILAIESSCDESALALFERGNGLVGEWISSQVSLHAEYGGVVPDLASREHLNNFGPLIAAVKRGHDLTRVSEIAVTSGPGLAGCLAMGIATAKALALSLKVPVFSVNHLRAHAHSVFLSAYENSPAAFESNVANWLPHMSVIVSGGNTLIARIDTDKSIEILGQTIDDAAGEALDKGAKLLGIGYPGGPKLEEIARGGDSKAYGFPRALLDKPTLDLSFSGLKTSIRYLTEKMGDEEVRAAIPDLCASYQEAVVDALIRKADRAFRQSGCRSVGLSGGVSNNGSLRARFESFAEKRKIPSFLARREHTGDNAGMIAFSHVFEGGAQDPDRVDVAPSVGLTDNLKG